MADESNLIITRKIHFFRVEHSAEFIDLFPASLEAIDKLRWEEQGRYLPDATDSSLLSVMPHSFQYPLRIEFGRTRRDNLPAIERKGVKKTLSIAEDAGLIDVCHVVIFEDGFVAVEFNRDAPRIGKLGEYLMFKGRNLPSTPRFQRLYEKDIVEVVNDIRNVSFLDIEIPPGNIGLIRQADESLADALDAQQRVNISKTIGVYFNAYNPQDSRLKKICISLLKALREADQEDPYKRLRIRGSDPHTGRQRSFNLLEDFLTAEVGFAKTSAKSRSIETDKAFNAIEDAYRQRVEALKKSLRVTAPWD